jgi:hypothetical protein
VDRYFKEGYTMRIVAGSIAVLSGALLWGFGAVASSLSANANSFQDKGTIAIIVGAVLVFVGIGTMAIGLKQAE